ncbi:MAG: pyridoxamine 5'-phosphate oxidase family protein [Sedimentitalea sp.]|nr:pyridoxamine 5'-phosphate oxidase family protein [Sedimentitalea sp.]
MTGRKDSDSDPARRLFSTLADTPTGMLGIEGSGQHMQPMTHFADEATQTLWFITDRGTDLAAAVGSGGTAHFTVTSDDHEVFASMVGPITQSENQGKLKDLWSPMVGAWFEGGPEDPDALLLEMPLQQASIWITSGDVLKFGYEMAKAALRRDAKPDIGDHVVIDFRSAA